MLGDNIIHLLTGVKGIMGFAGPEDRNVAWGRRKQQSALVIKYIIQYYSTSNVTLYISMVPSFLYLH